jgi:hypothetical protein
MQESLMSSVIGNANVSETKTVPSSPSGMPVNHNKSSTILTYGYGPPEGTERRHLSLCTSRTLPKGDPELCDTHMVKTPAFIGPAPPSVPQGCSKRFHVGCPLSLSAHLSPTSIY